MDWRSKAACLEADPELFFPLTDHGPSLLQMTEALEFCGRCDVRSECLEWAVDQEIGHGVWGGTTETERRSAKRAAVQV